MALEAVVFQQEPFSYGSCKDMIYSRSSSYDVCGFQQQLGQGEEEEEEDDEKGSYTTTCTDHAKALPRSRGFGLISATWATSPSNLMVQPPPPPLPPCSNSKEEYYLLWDVYSNSSTSPDHHNIGSSPPPPPPQPTPAAGPPSCRRKRRRTKTVKNQQEIENQRMTHIAVERNRRRQMNDYLALLRSIMPTSYVQRGDQASIIGGAINFVKELEQLLQSLEARKRMETTSDNPSLPSPFSGFFSFPQYSTSCCSTTSNHRSCVAAASGESSSMAAEKRSSSSVADVEVTMVESHACIKILSKRHPKQLLKLVSGLHSLGLYVLHLNLTSVQHMALYSFSVKVEDNFQLTTVNEIAAAVYEMVDSFQEEAAA